jgi:hypothetical protein
MQRGIEESHLTIEEKSCVGHIFVKGKLLTWCSLALLCHQRFLDRIKRIHEYIWEKNCIFIFTKFLKYNILFNYDCRLINQSSNWLCL